MLGFAPLTPTYTSYQDRRYSNSKVGQKRQRCPTFPRFIAVHVGHVLCPTYLATRAVPDLPGSMAETMIMADCRADTGR